MSQRNNRGGGVSFMQMVVGAMAFLKLKEKYDEYRQVSADEEEGRVALTSAVPDENDNNIGGRIALLDTDIPATHAVRQKKKKACCMCCGFDCSLFWKAIAVVLGIYTLYYGYKAIRWAATDAPSGLEGMPTFGESLGCKDAPFTYNNTVVTLTAPIGTRHSDHAFDVRGYGMGTITIADGDADAKEVKYEFTIKTNTEHLLDDISFVRPDVNDESIVTRSRFIIETSRLPGVNDKYCMKYDVKVFVPPNLKKLQIASHSSGTHIRFAPDARINNVDELFVIIYTNDDENLIVPSKSVTPKKLNLEVYRGWIVGDASIVEETSIITQRGDGVSNVKIHPAVPENAENPKAAILRTTTGAGRSDFTYITPSASKRQISSTHISSRNADMYLTYRQAEFSGRIKMESKSSTMTGATPMHIRGRPKTPDVIRRDEDDDGEDNAKWTHYVGDKDGKDEIYVNSRGWTGLYF